MAAVDVSHYSPKLLYSSSVLIPRIEIVVLNWNGRLHLENCLSALEQQSRQDFVILVVDNGSSDDSVVWLKGRGRSGLRVLELPENLGFAGGNASGLAVIRPDCEFVVLLNNDTAPEPGWLAALVAAADAEPRRGAVASLMVDWERSTIDSSGDGIRVTGRGYQRYHGRPLQDAPRSGPVFSACGGAVLYRRKLLDEIGFLDERFFMNGEDTDLCFRARLAGWEVWFCAEAVVRHRVSASQGVGSAASVYYNQRNHLWSVAKCMPASLLWKYCWVHALEQPARALFYARRGRFWAWLRGVCAGFAGIRPFLQDRRKIQRSRRVSPREIDRYLVYPAHLGGRDEEILPRP